MHGAQTILMLNALRYQNLVLVVFSVLFRALVHLARIHGPHNAYEHILTAA